MTHLVYESWMGDSSAREKDHTAWRDVFHLWIPVVRFVHPKSQTFRRHLRPMSEFEAFYQPNLITARFQYKVLVWWICAYRKMVRLNWCWWLMLLTKCVGDKFEILVTSLRYWWQVWDIGDKFEMLVTSNIYLHIVVSAKVNLFFCCFADSFQEQFHSIWFQLCRREIDHCSWTSSCLLIW